MTQGTKPPRHAVSAADLEEHLKEQVGFLKASAERFDAGDTAEAKRLAATLRVLLYDHGKKSKSLLGQLGKKNDFIDTALPLPDNVHPGFSTLVMQEVGATNPKTEYFAPLDGGPMRRLAPFDQWWESPVLSSQTEGELSRGDLVLIAANQHGGAHVDDALDRRYLNLTRENGLNWNIITPSGKIPMGDPVSPSIRQIAHEVLATLDSSYTLKPPKKEGMVFAAVLSKGWHSFEVKSPVPPVVRKPPVAPIYHAGRNDPCPCGSTKKFKKCHGAVKK